MRLLFVLPGEGGGGGAHSVVQESGGLARLGAEVAIAVSEADGAAFAWHYPEFTGDHPVRLAPFADVAGLRALLGGYDLAIATTAPSANLLARALDGKTKGLAAPAYYIQDYEPLFRMPGDRRWDEARASYTALGQALLFAKTDWLRRIVYDNHGLPVAKVSPSIDHGVYHPGAPTASDVVSISAMIRPKTPRRGPARTVRVLEKLAAAHGAKVKLTAFGCDAADYGRIGLTLSPSIEDRGVLRRREVAELFRTCDLFLDLSDYQAFGRSGLEAMASGCTPLLPAFGGADEYARIGENALVVDTRSEDAILDAVAGFIASGAKSRAAMARAGIDTALNYSIEKAALSEYRLFEQHLGAA